jgi:very-short-patch-repair endonuclease
MRDKPQTHHELARLAERQHGVVSAQQLHELGYSRSTIARYAATGRLHRVHRGVYAVGHRALSKEGQCLAAVFSCGDEALLSHRSAAWLWGMATRWRLPIDVTASGPRTNRSVVRVHSARTLTAADESSSEGIPVTAVPRTLLDFAAVEPRYLGWALDRAERLGLLDLIAIDELLLRSDGLRGVARLNAALEMHRPSAFTRSGLERKFLKLVRDAGLPQPSVNFFVAGYEVDAYWPTVRFGIELDTYDHHGGRASFESDRLKQEELKLAGVEITRITGARIDREPKAVAARLRRLLAQRRRDTQRPQSS